MDRLSKHLWLVSLLFAVSCATTHPLAKTDWSEVESALGRPGKLQPGNVFRVGFPRTDLEVELAGVRLRPPFALGSWAAFLATGDQTMAMGDLVLTEPEVGGVVASLLGNGLAVTAIHNHLLGEVPKLMYLHFSGHGRAGELAAALRAALGLTKTPMHSPPPADAPAMELATAEIDRILAHAGTANGGVYQYSIPRTGRIVEGRMEIPASMGMATAINFQPTGAGRAAITGDFVMTAGEVDAVMRALRGGNIAITALHSHMLDEHPRLFFMHFWANDDAARLAVAIRKALDQMNVR